MRAAIYGRVSTDKQENLNQLVQLREFAATQGWTVVREITDVASGGKADRGGLKQLFDAASKHEFDLILFWALDRLSREGVLQTLNYLERLTSYGVAYKSFTEQYLDSVGIFRDAVIGILATIARQERVRRSERTRAGLAIARSRGSKLGRPRKALHSGQIQMLRSAGQSYRTIATALGLSHTAVMNACKQNVSDSVSVTA